MNKIGLIGCSKKKLVGFYKAKDLYVGELFKKSKKYCELYLDDYFILSAKYGLLDKNKIIENYDNSLYKMNKKEILNWSINLVNNLKLKFDTNDELYLLCGDIYFNYWLNFNFDFKINLILKDLKKLGTRLQYLKQENNKNAEKNKFFS